jgi:RNA polymerase sigma-70 factor (ECF subfamily)
MISSENPESSGMAKNVKKALGDLHPRYRIPVILKDIEGFTQEEIAGILNIPVGTIKARISRGRSHLRKELERAVAC